MAWQRSKGRLVRPGDPPPPAAWADRRTAAALPIDLAAAHRRLARIGGEMALSLARGTVADADDVARWSAALRAVAEAMAGHALC
jgi:hypothetical protein